VIGYGFEHVLQGADHLLFLLTLPLTAPLAAVAGRWRRRTDLLPTGRSVLGVVTAFTLGHSVTLIASALGWVHVPSRLVEVLVAVSVGVAAIHALRPLVPHGENAIAAGFGPTRFCAPPGRQSRSPPRPAGCSTGWGCLPTRPARGRQAAG